MEKIKGLILVIVTIFCIQQVSAATISAASCSQTDVQAAIDSAIDGDSVNIPAGSCIWTDSVNIIDKDVSIVGAGQGTTIITYDGSDAYDSAAFLIDNDNLPKDNFEISHLTIINGMGDSASGATLIKVWDAGPDWRMHHITLTSEYSGNMIHVGRYTGSNSGLVDHCTFNKLGSGHIKGLQINAADRDVEDYNSPTIPLGHTSWNMPISLGTKDALYIEDCIFSWEDDYAVLDADEGARVVFRYNDITGANFGTHGHDGGSRDTGVFSYEIYSNSFNAAGTGLYTVIGLRGGTGVIYDNTFSGNYGATTNLYHYCACDPTVTCNGGWPTPCTYPCEGQIGRTAGNALEPLYFWDNVYMTVCQDPLPLIALASVMRYMILSRKGGIISLVLKNPVMRHIHIHIHWLLDRTAEMEIWMLVKNAMTVTLQTEMDAIQPARLNRQALITTSETVLQEMVLIGQKPGTLFQTTWKEAIPITLLTVNIQAIHLMTLSQVLSI